jgi:hypothetical protein
MLVRDKHSSTSRKASVVNTVPMYSHHLIFFVTYELAQKARLLHNTKLERLASDKPGNPYCTVQISTVDLLSLTSSDQLLFLMKVYFSLSQNYLP